MAGGGPIDSWTKQTLQAAGHVARAPRRGAHRKKRPRKPLPGMMLHQDGSTHEWVPGCQWDLIVTLDDATTAIYSAFFVDEEGTMSSLQGLREVIETQGLFSSLYTDRGSHYWHTDEVGGNVDRIRRTQVHRALQQLGVTLIPAYSPEARGRSERAFRTLQDRLPKELALAGITEMAAANRYLTEQFLRSITSDLWCERPNRAPPLSRGSVRPSPRSCVCTRSGSWPRITRCTITASAYRSHRTPIGSIT